MSGMVSKNTDAAMQLQAVLLCLLMVQIQSDHHHLVYQSADRSLAKNTSRHVCHSALTHLMVGFLTS